MVDPVWAASLGVVALVVAACGTGATSNRVFVSVGGALWGFRLGRHLWMRNHGKPEDPRYHAFRERWGESASSKMFWFFLQLQAFISMLLAIAFFVPAYAGEAASPTGIGAGVLVLGGRGRGRGRRHRRSSTEAFRGGSRASRQGVSRGAVALLASSELFLRVRALARLHRAVDRPAVGLADDRAAPPLLMAWLLLKVSGIPLLEARMADTREGYRDYMCTTSPLILWPPKNL